MEKLLKLIKDLTWYNKVEKSKEILRLLTTVFLQDAPEDGNIYGRKDGAWEEVTTGGVVPDASPTVKGISKLYNDLLDSNIDGGVTQEAVKNALKSNQYNQNNITFKNVLGDYFGTITTPRTGTLTFDTTDAVTGGISVVYYNNATLAIPSVWRTIGTFVPNELNKIYLERDSEGYITCNIVAPAISNEPSATIPTITVTNP